jgi:hypothetical protein
MQATWSPANSIPEQHLPKRSLEYDLEQEYSSFSSQNSVTGSNCEKIQYSLHFQICSCKIYINVIIPFPHNHATNTERRVVLDDWITEATCTGNNFVRVAPETSWD